MLRWHYAKNVQVKQKVVRRHQYNGQRAPSVQNIKPAAHQTRARKAFSPNFNMSISSRYVALFQELMPFLYLLYTTELPASRRGILASRATAFKVLRKSREIGSKLSMQVHNFGLMRESLVLNHVFQVGLLAQNLTFLALVGMVGPGTKRVNIPNF